MKAALAIAAAEVRGLRLAPLGCLLAGLVGHLAIYRLGRRAPGPDQAALIATVVVMCTQVGLAVVLGGNAVSRDLAERRLGFYLARPVPPLAYWAAKLSAAFLVAYVCGWLVLVPGFIVGPASAHLAAVLQVGRVWNAPGGLIVTAFAVALAAAATGAVRSRSGLVVFDVALLLATTAALLGVLGASWEQGTGHVVMNVVRPLLRATMLPLLLAASAAQIALGRLDLRRGHVWLSGILWSGLLAVVAGLALFSRVVASAAPEDLRLRTLRGLEPAPAGDHVVLEGADVRWREHAIAFFLDGEGRFVPKRGTWDTGQAWSANGRHFVWSSAPSPLFPAPLWQARPLQWLPGLGSSLWAMDFDAGAAPRLIARRPGYEKAGALSPSGGRVLLEGTRRKLVLSTGDGRVLGSVSEVGGWSDARFLSETVVRALRRDAWQGRIVDWDLDTGRLVERGLIAFEGDRGTLARLIPTHDFQGVLRFDGAGLFLHDLDGKLVARLVDGWQEGARAPRSAGLLSQGRIGSLELAAAGSIARLRVFDARGRTLLDTPVDGLGVGGESLPGVLVLARGQRRGTTREGERYTTPAESVFVDLATGGVVRREPGLYPAFSSWSPLQRSTPPEPGSLATRLFRADDEALVLLDLQSGSRKLLLRRSAS